MSDQCSAPKQKWSVWDWWVLRKNCRQRDVLGWSSGCSLWLQRWSSRGVGTSSQGASAVPGPLGLLGSAVGFMGMLWCMSLHVIPSL